MPLYDNAFPSNYEEIRTFYPVWYFDVLEMDAIWKAEGEQLDKVQDSVKALISNGFIDTADDATISSLERFLHINTDKTKTLEDRRRLVSSFFSGDSHIGAKEIKATVATFTTGTAEVAFADSEIRVSVTHNIADRLNLSDCLLVLQTRIPAHLGLSFKDILLPIPFTNRRGEYRLNTVTFRTSFSNTPGGEIIPLDGRRLLDGTWILNQTFSGITFPRFSVRLSCKTKESLSGAVTIDSMYTMDGSVRLNGSRKLNAQITKEVI